MKNIIEYKCKNCGAIIVYDSNSESLKCPFCDSQFNISDYMLSDSELNWTAGDKYNEYHCQSCGAEIITDETTAATNCPYCDSPIILTDRLVGSLKPDLIIPFKINKSEAKEALSNHFKGKTFLPKVFKNENHLDEIKGIYVPFWLFDTDVKVEATYKMKNTKIWTDSRNQYSEISTYIGKRSGRSHFEKVPVDGSEKIPNQLTESLETYDYTELKAFQPAYLSGYFADKYDVSAEQCTERMKERVSQTSTAQINSTVVGFDSIDKQSSNTSFINIKVHYALLPVWILNTTWKGQKYTFAMNGQTGKFVGDLPIDKWLMFKYYILNSLIFSGGLFAIVRLLGGIL